MIREITSATNPLVKQLRALSTSKKARQESGTFLIEGWRGIETLLHHTNDRYRLETLVATPEWTDDPRLPDDMETVLFPEHLFEKISDVCNAQGIMGVVRHLPRPFEFNPDAGRYLLLDNLRDPGNLGTLIRSAVGAAFDAVLLYGDCVEPFTPKVVRSTMGTFAFAPLWQVGDEAIGQLLETGYELCATTGQGGENLYAATFSSRILLAIGSEAHGISDGLMQRATRRLTIPLAPACESLNAAIAGSICMFQMAQRTRR